MKSDNLGGLFLRHLVMAVPWGIIFLIVMLIASLGLKQQIKEGIQYTFQTAIQESLNVAYRYQTVVPVKQNIKEGVEFVAGTAAGEVKALLHDPQVRQDLKEVFETGAKN